MDATTARATLHHWIDEADDALVIGLAELSAQLTAAIEQQLVTRGLLPQADPQPGMKALPFTMNDERAIVARLTPKAQRLADNPLALAEWLATLDDHERAVMMDWVAQHSEYYAQATDRLRDVFRQMGKDPDATE